MATLAVAWVAFPLLLGGISLGAGLFVQSVSRIELPGVLLLPVGFAAVIVLADAVTASATTAKAAVPAVVALAAAGFTLAYPLRLNLERWTSASTLLVYAVYAAPIVLTGTATFAGYIKLDDTATWLALADNALVRGRSLAGVAPSTYWALLHEYLHTGYPLGSMLPLGIGAKLVREDPLWVFQPYLAFQAVLLALTFQGVLAGVIRSAWVRAVVVFLAAQSALFYGYATWGAIKEVVTVPLLALAAVLVSRLLRNRPLGNVVPLAITIAAILAVLDVGGGVWIAIALVPALLLARKLPPRALALRAVVFAGLTVVLSIPSLVIARAFLGTAQSSLTSGGEFGTLGHALDPLQIFGIWPVGDFRSRPTDLAPTYVMIGIVCLGALVALADTLYRRRAALPTYVAVSALGCVILTRFGSPWVDAKSFATASPGILLVGIAGLAIIWERGFRLPAGLAVAAVGGMVLWTSFLAYHEVWLAPADQLAELGQIGKDFAGQGPAFVTEFQPYGARDLLRSLDPEDASGVRVQQDFLANGETVASGGFADIDDFAQSTLANFPLLILPVSPVASRPPSNYALAEPGKYYEVWKKQPNAPQVLKHVSLGDDLDPAAVPSCRAVRALASVASKAGGELAAVPRTDPIVVSNLARLSHPSSWPVFDGDVFPLQPGDLTATIDVANAGRYELWIGGSFPGRLELLVDGVVDGSAQDRLEHPGQYVEVGGATLTAGRHSLVMRYLGSSWRPGSNAHLYMSMDSVVLGQETANLPVQYEPPADYSSFCGKSLDWIEAVS